jgi:hypothetical protein
MQVQKTSLFLLDEQNIFQDINDVEQMIDTGDILPENQILSQTIEMTDMIEETGS